jgi:hypothetical protein
MRILPEDDVELARLPPTLTSALNDYRELLRISVTSTIWRSCLLPWRFLSGDECN